MVAFSSSRRHRTSRLPQSMPEALAVAPDQGLAVGLAASRRGGDRLSVLHSPDGAIQRVRIGFWRSVSAGPQRRIAEVRELSSDRVAVRIERLGDGGDRPTSEIWQLYDRQGRLEAAMQSSPDGKFAILTNYRTRQSCRVAPNGRNELETVETWDF